MLVRIVKMTFQPSKTDEFLSNFERHKLKIRSFSGCQRLELYREQNGSNVFFTYSYWDSTKHLEAYRNSELFKNVWKETKTLFSDKPKAWSVDKLVVLGNNYTEAV